MLVILMVAVGDGWSIFSTSIDFDESRAFPDWPLHCMCKHSVANRIFVTIRKSDFSYEFPFEVCLMSELAKWWWHTQNWIYIKNYSKCHLCLLAPNKDHHWMLHLYRKAYADFWRISREAKQKKTIVKVIESLSWGIETNKQTLTSCLSF